MAAVKQDGEFPCPVGHTGEFFFSFNIDNGNPSCLNIYMNCDHLPDLKSWQYAQLLKHIQDNQYYLGQKLGHYVDWKEAEHDFFDHYILKVGKELRLNYCSTICPVAEDCELGKLFRKTLDS